MNQDNEPTVSVKLPDMPELSRSFLFALFHHLNSPRSDGKLHENALAAFGYPAAIARGLLSSLEGKGLVEHKNRLDGPAAALVGRTSVWWELTARGAEAMYAVVSDPKPQVRVPASDRFVDRSDNSAAFDDAETKLADLAEAVRQSNDLSVTQDQRLALLSEIEGVLSLLKNAVVRPAALYNAARASAAAGWLAKEAGSGAVRALAAAAVTALLAIAVL